MNKKNIVELVGIYIILIGLSYAFYVVLVAVKANDSVASSLLSWSATMFATIALLYTFNSWREQKSSEVIAQDSKYIIENIIKNIGTLGEIIYKDTNSTIRNENVINNFLICKKLDLEIHSKIYSIDNLIIIDNLDNLYENFNYQNSTILDNLEFRIEKDDFKEYERYRPLLIEKHKVLTKIGEEIIGKLSFYSVHQETLKLKKPSKIA